VDLPPQDVRAYSDAMVRFLISHAITPSAAVDDSADMTLRVATPLLRRGSAPPAQLPTDQNLE
jgi:hypothetical protein